ncbi:MAG: hypothetical protein INQ03_22600 [Candidatus Heimdallarchaeota archaeon]|nr:hypothetical protein [Candidatus Heimdallarchaeota archaeon]
MYQRIIILLSFILLGLLPIYADTADPYTHATEDDYFNITFSTPAENTTITTIEYVIRWDIDTSLGGDPHILIKYMSTFDWIIIKEGMFFDSVLIDTTDYCYYSVCQLNMIIEGTLKGYSDSDVVHFSIDNTKFKPSEGSQSSENNLGFCFYPMVIFLLNKFQNRKKKL